MAIRGGMPDSVLYHPRQRWVEVAVRTKRSAVARLLLLWSPAYPRPLSAPFLQWVPHLVAAQKLP